MLPRTATVVLNEYSPGGKKTAALQFCATAIAACTAGASSTCACGVFRELLRKLSTETTPVAVTASTYGCGHWGGGGRPSSLASVGRRGGWDRSWRA